MPRDLNRFPNISTSGVKLRLVHDDPPVLRRKKKTKSALEHAICYKCKSVDLKILKKKNT